MEIGRLGVWTWLDGSSAAEAADFAGQIEAWGYSALWVPEAVGRDPFCAHFRVNVPCWPALSSSWNQTSTLLSGYFCRWVSTKGGRIP